MSVRKPYVKRESCQKLKVLLLGPFPPPYMGPSVATEIILKSSLNKHFTIYHLNTGTHRALSTLGVASLRRTITNLIICSKMIWLIINRKPDLVLIPISQTTTGFIKDSLFVIISVLFKRRTLLQLRGGNFKNWFTGATKMIKVYVMMLLRRTQGVIVLGEKLKYLFSDFFCDNNIFVVPNGADYEISTFKRTENPSSVYKLLYLGNLQPSKGIEDVLEAVIYLKKTYTLLRFQMDIVGSWRDDITKNRCLKLVKYNKLPVDFHLPVEGLKIFNYLLDSDIFIFPPREPEGHPWVIVEAMAAGLPIISTDQGAITESVIDGVNGYIVGKQNSKQIAEKVNILLGNSQLREKMGAESRRMYLEKFTEEKMVERMVYAFNSVLK